MKDSTVLITGGAGSFGKAMTKKLLELGVKEIRIFSRHEESQVDMSRRLSNDKVKFILGDIVKYDEIEKATRGCDYVLHAAALKHVGTCEEQPLLAKQINIDGSINVMQACINNNVKRLICLSTDKSANACTTYGTTKYMMECIARHIENKNTDIICTRYGNVIGSSGSVIPYFKQLKEQGKPLTINDPNATRFFMPMDEAIDLVLYALEKGKHGDLIVHKNKGASVQMIADCISDNQEYKKGFRVEKTDEALLSERELNHSKDIDGYTIVREDITSDVKYDRPLTSDNAEMYSIDELKRLVDEC